MNCGESEAGCNCDDMSLDDCDECGGILAEPPTEPKVRADICNECPFRRAGMPGWLGKNSPEEFVANALTDVSVSCHLQVNQEQKRKDFLRSEATAPRCRGALTFLRNICKMPRDPKMAALVRTVPANREKVFAMPNEFVVYHNKAKVKSWTFDDDGKPKRKKK